MKVLIELRGEFVEDVSSVPQTRQQHHISSWTTPIKNFHLRVFLHRDQLDLMRGRITPGR